ADALEVKLVLEAIYERYGYDFRDYAPDSIARRVKAAAAKIGARHLAELQHRLIHEVDVMSATLELLTVRVTEMFRDPHFYRAVRRELVPILRTYPQLKVWHAGCASGEEVYAMAILLSEAGLYERSQIYATDVSGVALEQAREGVYPEASFAGFAQNYGESGGSAVFADYWSRAYDRIAIREDLRQHVHFFQHDLVSDYALGEMQVIFCRNVLIYFGERLRERVFSMFSDALHVGGFLCLGSSEALPASRRSTFEEFSAVERIYRKRGAA
ncbi:MAG TPA: protein-glutamate O-methyltransferase CheR, partial [Polyangiaceae bacterium]